MERLTLVLADKQGLKWAQEQVIAHHYLHKPVDVRCSPVCYLVMLDEQRVGCLIFGRPEATKVNGWYGSVEDVKAGRCALTRWEVLNLARVWLDPMIQAGGAHPIHNAATQVVGQALKRIGFDYLTLKPPVFPEEPYEIRQCLSYCDTRIHKGTLYRAANFALYRENEQGIQTYRRELRRLSHAERRWIERLSEQDPRAQQYRTKRAVADIQQADLWSA